MTHGWLKRSWFTSSVRIGAVVATVSVLPAASQTWEIETAHGNALSSTTSLALDGASNPHIGFTHYNYTIQYARKQGSQWYAEGIGGATGIQPSLALDASGCPHIGYRNLSAWELQYARKATPGGRWIVETVDFNSYHPSLVLNGSGYPHITYDRVSGGIYRLTYAFKDATGWHWETPDPSADVYSSSLALDQAGFPHVSYYDCVGSDLKYAYKSSGGWHVCLVDTLGDVGQYPSMVLDSSGHPHISYYDNTNGDLKYAYRDASGWHVTSVDTAGNVGQYASIALDTWNQPHVSYYDGTYLAVRGLKYAWRDLSGWHVSRVDTLTGTGLYTSLAVDGDGRAHISYTRVWSTWTHLLMYARRVAPASMMLAGELVDGALHLTWAPVAQVSAYWVFGATNLPWFVPGTAPGYQHRLAILPQGTTTWASSAGVGDPDANWTYLVIGVNASGQELTRSNRIGEHDYAGEMP